IRSADLFQLVTRPLRALPTMASSDDSTMAARRYAASAPPGSTRSRSVGGKSISRGAKGDPQGLAGRGARPPGSPGTEASALHRAPARTLARPAGWWQRPIRARPSPGLRALAGGVGRPYDGAL